MTSFLGPEQPLPLSLISESNQKHLKLVNAKGKNDKVYQYDDKYYDEFCKLLWMEAEIDLDDIICVICSQKNRIAEELETRLNLIYPIVKIVPRTILYEGLANGERDINVGSLPMGAEDYFSDENSDDSSAQLFNKVILVDGLELVEDRLRLLVNAKRRLKNHDSNIVIIHRTADMITLPFYDEIIQRFERTEIKVEDLLTELLDIGMLIGWTICVLPIQIACSVWLNQLANHYPPLMECVPISDVPSGLRQLVDTSFKYTGGDGLSDVGLKDTFVLLVATNCRDEDAGQEPYRISLGRQLQNTQYAAPTLTQPLVDRVLRLKVTPDIRTYLPTNLDQIQKAVPPECDKNQPKEEWWGTIPSLSLGLIDHGRINRFLK